MRVFDQKGQQERGVKGEKRSISYSFVRYCMRKARSSRPSAGHGHICSMPIVFSAKKASGGMRTFDEEGP